MKLSRGNELLYHKDINSRYIIVLEYPGAYNVGFVYHVQVIYSLWCVPLDAPKGKSAMLSCLGPRWLRLVFPALK